MHNFLTLVACVVLVGLLWGALSVGNVAGRGIYRGLHAVLARVLRVNREG